MKTIRSMIAVASLAGVLAQPAWAAPDATSSTALASAFATEALPSVSMLTDQDMAETQGRLGLLALPLAIVGVDLALITAFWGVYVPFYSGGCAACSFSLNNP